MLSPGCPDEVWAAGTAGLVVGEGEDVLPQPEAVCELLARSHVSAVSVHINGALGLSGHTEEANSYREALLAQARIAFSYKVAPLCTDVLITFGTTKGSHPHEQAPAALTRAPGPGDAAATAWETPTQWAQGPLRSPCERAGPELTELNPKGIEVQHHAW